MSKMTIQEAIEKAIEGGLNIHKGYEFNQIRWIGGNTGTVVDLINQYEGGTGYMCISVEELLLNSSFWQAFDKSMGWSKRDEQSQKLYRMSGGGGEMMVGMYHWCQNWHKFIDHLARGKSIESFFETLDE